MGIRWDERRSVAMGVKQQRARRGVVTLIAAFGLFFAVEATPAKVDYWKLAGIERPPEKILAADFTIPGLDGKMVSLKDLRGKVVFLNFWATWCVPCRKEMPSIERLHQEFKDQGLVVYGIDFMESPAAAKAFVRSLELTFPILLDANGEVAKQYRVFGLPATFLIGPEGELKGKAIGDRDWDSDAAKAVIKELLKSVSKPAGGRAEARER